MSQSRTRKSTKKDSAPKDAVQSPQNSHHKKKIPKAVRYDLESTLLELCDVWFQDIKPHLIKNNIKVHVNERCQRQKVGPGTCNHLNPGADRDRRRLKNVSFANCYSTPTTVSRALCPRQRAPAQPPDSQPPLKKNSPKLAAANSPSCAVACSELVPCHLVRSPPRPVLPPLRSAALRPNAARPVPRLPLHYLNTFSTHEHHLPITGKHENSGISNFNQNKIVHNKTILRPPIAEINRISATEQPRRQPGYKIFNKNNNVDSKRSLLTGILGDTHPVRHSETKKIIQRIHELADSPRKDERDKDRGKMNKRRESEIPLNQRERDRVMIQNTKENCSHVKISPKLKTKLKWNKKIEDTKPPWR